MSRIDEFPAYQKDGVNYNVGRVLPFGATVIGDNAVNFSIYSKEATYCELLLYHLGDKKPYFVFPFPENCRIGCTFSVMVFDIDWENTEYGYRFDGPNDRSKGYRFDRSKIVLDPYAKLVSGRDVWHKRTYGKNKFQHRGRIIREDFFWEDDRPLNIPMKDLVIYEMHVRGFTKDKSSKVKNNGTFAGVVEKIPYLKSLGINCIEFMPIFEFEEFIPMLSDKECNYWGYVTYNYFSPKAGYAALGASGMATEEMKNMVKQLHKNGIEIILDVVFNHTAEYGDDGEYISFRGVDNRTYYHMDKNGQYANYSACGNTVNCNNPVVRSFIIDSLRYWVTDYHIDGFRIDEAPIFARDQDGNPMISPPLVESLKNDPILSHTKLISEGWDPCGLNTIGNFPSGWADWNPRVAYAIKGFVKGMAEKSGELTACIEGSPDMFPNGGADSSVNYINCHDGMTLYDSVAFNKAHNETNAFTSPQDTCDNCSWNCGQEGETDNLEIDALRRRQMKNMLGILLMSRGVPMFYAGDEFANTQFGNNNAFSQDNLTSWLDWKRLKTYSDVFDFTKRMIAFRKEHPVICRADFFTGYNSSGYPEMSWHSEKTWDLDRMKPFHSFAFMYSEPKADFNTKEDCFIYCVVNSHWEDHTFELPIIPEGMEWEIVSYTGDPDNKLCGNICHNNVLVMQRSFMVLIGKRH